MEIEAVRAETQFLERDVMKHTKYLNFRPSALSLALAGLMVGGGALGGVITNSNQDLAPGAFKGDCGVVGQPTACVGAWNLDNVDVKLYRVDGTTEFGCLRQGHRRLHADDLRRNVCELGQG